jgi:filamentous hemagglutinin family protein
MPRRDAARTLQTALLASVSVLTLLTAGTPARAGNLLARSAPSPVSNAMAGAGASAQQAAAMAQQSMASLARATQAIAAMQAAQSAARNLVLAAPSTVPDGLASGGLVPDSGLASAGVANPVSTWTNANTPVQSTGSGQTLVTVQQTAQKAILNWSSFNIGKNTELYINQSQGNSSTGNDWIALNRIADPTGVPSQIMGSIKAEGSVYVINQNGIIFGGASQVNVSSLIVSSLNLFSNTVATSNNRFLTGGIGDLTTTNFSTDSILLTTNNPNAGAITIQPGASINLASNGLAVIAAPNLTNSGMITAPSGQVALIAGIGVSYTYNYFSGASEAPGFTNDSSTLLVFSNSGQLTSGQNDVTPVGALVNNGLVLTPRGNITLLGGTIAQNGVAVATTSVQQAGSIVITGQYDTTPYTGSVTFGPQAVTAVLPDTDGVTLPSDPTSLAPFTTNPSTIVFAPQLPIQGPGTINVIGQAIDFQGGTLVYAPGQTINARTLVHPDPRPIAPPVPAPGRILLEAGAVLDVSGIPDTVLPAAANLLTLTLGGNELADDPLQQNGPLYGQTVTVDMRLTGTNAETGESWVGTPLANLSSYANLEQNSIGQLLVNGGSIALGGSEFVGAPGSIINLTGGYIQYLGGWVQTTRLVGDDGHIYNIGSADPLVTYVGIAGQETITDSRWGVKNTYTASLVAGGYYEPGYVQGGNAGTLTIGVGGAFVFDATLMAGTAAGTGQVEAGPAPSGTAPGGTYLPTGGSFTFTGDLPIEIGDPDVLSMSSLQALSLPSGFTMSTPLLAVPGSVYANGNVISSRTLDDAGLSAVSFITSSPIVEDAGTTLAVQPGGSISLGGSSGNLDPSPVTVLGSLTAHGGTISILATNITIGPQAVLDVSGLFVNDAQQAPGQPAAPTFVNAGSIILEAVPSITLAAGSLLDLEGGGQVLPNGQLQTISNGAPAGAGGNLTLVTDYNQQMPPTTNGAPPPASVLALGGTIDALGMSGGGTLTLQAVALQIGGNPATTPSYAYYFDPTSWGNLGFGTFKLSSVLQSEVPAGATVALHHQNLLPNYSMITTAPTGSNPAAYATPGYLTGTLLSPTNLSITAGLEEAGNINSITPSGQDYAQVDAGAQIIGDPGATISLTSWAMTSVLGSIVAPGGSISLTVDYTLSSTATNPMGPLYLGPNGKLDVSGTTVINPLASPVETANGVITPLTGQILPGGTVSLKDDQTPILIAPGAVINVSGASGAFDVTQSVPGRTLGNDRVLSRLPQWSNAGQIDIEAFNLLLEGTLIGQGGAPQANGATLQITGGTDILNDAANLILVQDTASALAAANLNFDLSTYVPAIQPHSFGVGFIPGLGPQDMVIGVDKIDGTGVSNLILSPGHGTFGFAGQVSLTIDGSFTVSSLYYTAANAGNINWTSTATGPILPSNNGVATTDGASLTVNAQYIEISGPNITSSGAASGLIPTPAPNPTDATMTFNAGEIDIAGIMLTRYVGQTNFFSTGDIRLLPAQFLPSNGIDLLGYFLTSGNVAFKAADIYPATDTAFVIQAVGTVCNTCATPNTMVSFAYPDNGGPSATTPLSAGGTLLVDANNIIQNGEISAPFGSIILGIPNGSLSSLQGAISAALSGSTASGTGFYEEAAPTQSVILGKGSITSVSANGNTIPYGSTVDQTTWVYDPITNNPSWLPSNASASGFAAFNTPLTQAPQGVVTVTSASIAYDSGAVVNISGGGDLEAAEWIPGTGGSRNVLLQYNTSYASSTTGTQVPTYPDARQVYAILPGYNSNLAPYDATLSQGIPTPGQAIYLAGGNGLPAGVYTLLPGQYATLPGAYRVVMNTGVTNPLITQTQALADGTLVMTGYLTNDLTGARPSVTQQFQVQSQAVWEKYSQYAFTSANSFFPAYASTNDLAAPYVPADAGRLALAAISGLTLGGTVDGTPGAGGFGGQVDISSQFIEIVGSGEQVQPGYLAISAQSLDTLGADSLLIGGTRQMTANGTVITPTANGVIVATDANDPLVAPEIMLVAAPQFQNSTIALDGEGDKVTIKVPVAGTGQVSILAGSVVEASGAGGNTAGTPILIGGSLNALPLLPTSVVASNNNPNTEGLIQAYYTTLDAALGTLVRLSTGSPAQVQMPSEGQLDPGTIPEEDNLGPTTVPFTIPLPSLLGAASGTGAVIQSGAQVEGGNVLTIATTGNTTVQSGTLLSANNISATSSSITFVGAGATAPASGMAIDAATLAQLEQAANVNLQSLGTISFLGNVNLQMANPASMLTLGGGGLTSNGGAVTIAAPTLVLDNETNAQGSAGPGTGALSINVGELVFGSGNNALSGFGSASFVASKGILAQGTGSMNFGALPVTLETPVLIADTSSAQTLTTTGALSVVPVSGGSAMTSDAVGGAITLQGSSVTVSVPIEAPAGNITLQSSAGDITVSGTGSLIAHGVAQMFGTTPEYASGGTIALEATVGTVNLQLGSVVDFSGAAGSGDGGSLSISATGTTPVTFGGTLLGATASGATASNFSLNTASSVGFDNLAQMLTSAGVTGAISIEAGTGDLLLSHNLTASQISLTADAGKVSVTGTITANGAATTSGEIDLYGATGVDVEGSLLATGSPNSQTPGGIITIGTTGTGSTTSLNATYGYENVDSSASGIITIGATAVINASGGTVTLRAPILDALNAQGSNVNVSIAPGAKISAGAVFLNAYAVWSTADRSTNPNQHFDGIVDPAGWYQSNGTLEPGTFTDVNGNTVATWSGSALTNDDGTANNLAFYLTNDYFTPTTYTTAHAVFYGGYDPNSETFNPASPDAGSLPAFVQQPGIQLGNTFTGIANFTARPEIDLVNPGTAVNNGNISVLTNWNLGAAVMNADGSLTLAYRYQGTIAPVVALRAAGDINIDASISDGFFASALVPVLGASPATEDASAISQYTTDTTGGETLTFSGASYPYSPLFNGSTQVNYYSFSISGKSTTLQGTTTIAGLEPNDTYYDEIQAPQTGGSIAYYNTYNAYASEYNSWEFQNVRAVANASYKTSASATSKFFILEPSLETQPSSSPPSLSSYANNYPAYATAYYNWISGISTSLIGTVRYPTPTPPPSTDLSLSDWSAYYNTAYSAYIGFGTQLETITVISPRTTLDIAVYLQAPAPMPTALFQPYVVPNYNDAVANLPSNMAQASMPLPIQLASLVAGQSTSYQFVAGAAMNSPNPLAVSSDGVGDVLVNDNIAWQQLNSTNAEMVAPTTVRTGIGSIDIAAAGNFELTDQIAPGVVYTAGTPDPSSPGNSSVAIALGKGAWNSGGLAAGEGISSVLTPDVNPQDAGNITISVGGDIDGVENVVDTLARGYGAGANVSPASGLTSDAGAFIGQFWTAWLLTNPADPNVPWYVNFGSFDQGIMSVGGDIAVKAGGNIHDLAVSTPTTAWLDSNNVQHITGGGNLSVIAGGSIYSGDFYVGQGAGSIRAGGAITWDFALGGTGTPVYSADPMQTVVAAQYGSIVVEARQSVNIGGVYDPTYIGDGPISSYQSAFGTTPNFTPYITSMSTDSAASIESAAGDVIFNSALIAGGGTSSLLLPASLNLVAFDGGIDIEHGGGLYPSATGTLSIVADQSIDLAIPVLSQVASNSTTLSSQLVSFSPVGNISGTSLGKLDYRLGAIDSAGDAILPTEASQKLADEAQFSPAQYEDPSLVQNGATASVLAYSLNGSLVDGAPLQPGLPSLSGIGVATGVGSTAGQISFIPNAPAQIYAGGNITDLPFYGENFTAADITSIIAGGNIGYNILGNLQPAAIEIAGPGTLDVQAGGNIDFQTQRVSSPPETGIRTIGNSIDTSANPDPDRALASGDTRVLAQQYGNPYLPQGGASVNVLFGVGPGVDYQGFFSQYLNPANFAANGFTALFAMTIGGVTQNLSLAEASSFIEGLSPIDQQLVAEQLLFQMLNQVGLDYNNASSPYYHQYSRGYQAINTLFPASDGYTRNALTGGTNGANQVVHTGDLDLRGSTIQTQQGGNISILGPGGRILVGSAVASPGVDPASEGILTLESGNIATFTDTDVLVAQSRVMTEQGGSIVMWSSNGNLDAGKGAKTSVSAPPPKFDCDIDYRCSADIKGAVSGAGIATLQSLPGVPVGDANLIAPRGTVNAGAAGIRVSGNLNVAALIVANTFNIQVQGTVTGLPAAVAPNIGSLTSASNAAGQAAAAATDAAKQARSGPPPQELPSIITVEVVGYGGATPDQPQRPQDQQRQDEERRRKSGQQSYNPNSAFQVIGLGDLTR